MILQCLCKPLIILGEPSFGKLIDEYLHDFDIFHLAHATELLHYIDPKYLSVELGGSRQDITLLCSLNYHILTGQLKWIHGWWFSRMWMPLH